VIKTSDAANTKVIKRAISSPSRKRERKEREPATGPALGIDGVAVVTFFRQSLLNAANGFFFFLHHFLG